METGTSITERYWIATDRPRDLPDLEGIDDFRNDLAADYLSIVKGRPAGAGGLVHLYIEIITLDIVIRLRERAKEFSGIEPQHYVYPAFEHGYIAPTRPQVTFRTAWRNLTRAIQCPACRKLQKPGETCTNTDCKASIRDLKSPLAGLRFHALRHHAITELAESQVSDQTVHGYCRTRQPEDAGPVFARAKRGGRLWRHFRRSPQEAGSAGAEAGLTTQTTTQILW